jgi:co-chaperonin GroES (HSP10)
MEAYRNNFLLKPVKAKDTTESGIFLPAGSGETKNVCEVVSCGPDVVKKLDPGTRVVFANGKIFTYNGQDFICCNESEIYVVLS